MENETAEEKTYSWNVTAIPEPTLFVSMPNPEIITTAVGWA